MEADSPWPNIGLYLGNPAEEREEGLEKTGRHGTDLSLLHICDIYVVWSICGTPRVMGAGAVPCALMVSPEPTPHARFPCTGGGAWSMAA